MCGEAFPQPRVAFVIWCLSYISEEPKITLAESVSGKTRQMVHLYSQSGFSAKVPEGFSIDTQMRAKATAGLGPVTQQ